MASYYTHVTHISTFPHTPVSIHVHDGEWQSHTPCLQLCLRDSVSTYPRKYTPPHTFLYLSILINDGCSFLYMTLCNNERWRDRRSGHSHKSCRTSVIQSIIHKHHVAYKDVPTYHSSVYHARVLDLPLLYISKFHLSDQPPILV